VLPQTDEQGQLLQGPAVQRPKPPGILIPRQFESSHETEDAGQPGIVPRPVELGVGEAEGWKVAGCKIDDCTFVEVGRLDVKIIVAEVVILGEDSKFVEPRFVDAGFVFVEVRKRVSEDLGDCNNPVLVLQCECQIKLLPHKLFLF
jgi:hypothetical protein